MGLMQIFQEFSITIQQKMRFFHFRKAPWGFPFVPSGDGFKLVAGGKIRQSFAQWLSLILSSINDVININN